MKQVHKASDPGQGSTPLLFAAVIFISAFLLFLIQPLIAKYLLPWFGGSQAVWTTCLLFFQVFLLLGYAYAHLLTKWLELRWQVILHIVLLVSSFFLLPITPSEHAKPVLRDDPTWQVLALLTSSVGFPYFLLSATGPLLQKWYTYVNPRSSPYRLYALSNVGSLLALVIYPVVLEPLLSRYWQATGWSWGVGLFVIGCSFCAIMVWRKKIATATTGIPVTPSSQYVPYLRTRLFWLALPATASVLLLAITNKLCQEIAVVPFLWVLPLMVYLISFIICFDRPGWYSRLWFGVALILVYGGVIAELLTKNDYTTLISLAIFPALLFVACMVCHGELVRLKPPTEYLTTYYLSIAAGGALGGLFVAIIAPLIFSDYTEFPIGLVFCAILLLVLHFTDTKSRLYGGKPRWAWAGFVVALLAFIYGLQQVDKVSGQDVLRRVRNFYGTLTVVEVPNDEDPNYDCRKLRHGTILHGAQFIQYPQIATSYYTINSGIGRCLQSFPRKDRRKIGAVGLGVGTIATWMGPNDTIRFYEINPAVKALAYEYFTYLAECRGKVEIVPGDARLSLENEQPQNYDILVLDAFNSDTPPVHLLTEEAFELYKKHLRPDGVLALHISCRYIEFSWLVTALAEHAGLSWRYVVDYNSSGVLRMPSDWVLASKNQALLNDTTIVNASVAPRSDYSSRRLWTDDYTSLLPFLTWTW